MTKIKIQHSLRGIVKGGEDLEFFMEIRKAVFGNSSYNYTDLNKVQMQVVKSIGHIFVEVCNMTHKNLK